MNWKKSWEWLSIIVSWILAIVLADKAQHANSQAALDGFLSGALVMMAFKELTHKFGGKS